MIIALLAVLVLGAFTACNGDVNAELAGGKRVITLEILSGGSLSFDGNGTKTKVVEVPADCDTWAKLLAKVTDIRIIWSGDEDKTYTLKVFTNETPATHHGKIYFFDEYYPVFGLVLETKSLPNPDTTEASQKIVLGGTYVLTSEPT